MVSPTFDLTHCENWAKTNRGRGQCVPLTDQKTSVDDRVKVGHFKELSTFKCPHDATTALSSITKISRGTKCNFAVNSLCSSLSKIRILHHFLTSDPIVVIPTINLVCHQTLVISCCLLPNPTINPSQSSDRTTNDRRIISGQLLILSAATDFALFIDRNCYAHARPHMQTKERTDTFDRLSIAAKETPAHPPKQKAPRGSLGY
jgi:hypothetical protein